MVLGFGDDDLRPTEEAVVEMMTRNWDETMEIVAERRANPGMDDLIDVLVHSEVDGERLSDVEIFMGLGLLGAAGNDSTRSVFTSGMLGLFENPDQLRLLRDDPGADPRTRSRSCCGCTRPSPTSAARQPATSSSTAQTIAEGDKVLLWYVVVEPRRVRLRRTASASTSPASPTTRPSAPAAATSASAPRSRGSRSGCC